jgi:hypothetical protein
MERNQPIEIDTNLAMENEESVCTDCRKVKYCGAKCRPFKDQEKRILSNILEQMKAEVMKRESFKKAIEKQSLGEVLEA